MNIKALMIEIVVLIILFTIVCTINTLNVNKHLDWVALNYPPDVVNYLIKQGKIQLPKTLNRFEKLKKKFPILIILIILLTAIVYFCNGCRDFISAFEVCFIVWTIVDWYDAIVLDCLWFCHSKKVRVEGTENMDKEYGDYMFHIRGSCIGMLLGLFVSIVVGLCVLLISII